jgi:Tfp pilus assembly protein FimT
MDVRAKTLGRDRGLTAIELITTVAVAIVLLAAGIPGLRGMLVRQEVTVAVTELMTHLQLARISAVTSGQRIVMCPTSDGKQCADTFEWAGGFMVFEDRDADRELGPAEPHHDLDRPAQGGVPARGHGRRHQRDLSHLPDRRARHAADRDHLEHRPAEGRGDGVGRHSGEMHLSAVDGAGSAAYHSPLSALPR